MFRMKGLLRNKAWIAKNSYFQPKKKFIPGFSERNGSWILFTPES